MAGRCRERRLLVALSAAIATLAPATAISAELTDVIDAADSDVYFDPDDQSPVEVDDPYDFHFDITFQQTFERMKVNREKCARSEFCPDAEAERFNKELRYERTINQLDLDFEAAIYHDLSLTFKLPIVLGDQRRYKYARNGADACEFFNEDDPKCVNQTNSTVDPSDERIAIDRDGGADDPFPNTAGRTDNFGTYRYADIPSETGWLDGPSRSGVGDLSFGIQWTPWNEERYFREEREGSPWLRKSGRSTLLLGFEYTAPTATVARVDNEAVGRGAHWLDWRVAASRRYEYIDPYAELSFTLPIGSDGGLFRDFGGGQPQGRVNPAPRGEITAGIEVIPWEVRPLSKTMRSEFDTPDYYGEHRKVSVDLRGRLGFVGEGREYGPLFDLIGQSPCQGVTLAEARGARRECGWMAEKWANAGFGNTGALDPFNANAPADDQLVLNDDGITTHEGYGYVGLQLGVSVQPTKWVSIHTRVAMDYQQDRFLTFAKSGENTRGRSPDPDDPSRTIPDDNAPKDDTVSFDDIKERNPVYNPTYDGVGRRFRAAENTIFMWNIGITAQF